MSVLSPEHQTLLLFELQAAADPVYVNSIEAVGNIVIYRNYIATCMSHVHILLSQDAPAYVVRDAIFALWDNAPWFN